MVDFEIGFILSFQQLFPATLIKGCFFHLSQIIYRQVVDHGLLARYRDDVEFVQEVRMIAALSFVPVNDVIDAFNALAGNADANLQPILDHIEDNYIDHMRRGHFRPARFPMSMWNMHDRVLDNLPRTNNSVEGWHHAFAASCGGHHLNFWRFLNVIKNEEDLSRVTLIHARPRCTTPSSCLRRGQRKDWNCCP